MTHKHVVLPEAVGSRPSLPHNRYALGTQPMTIDGVDVKFGTPSKQHIINAPTGEGHTSRTLRRFGLLLSRYKLPDIKKRSRQWDISESAIEATGKVVSHHAFRESFGYDSTVGTVSTELVTHLLNEPNPTKETFVSVAGIAGTEAYKSMLDGITDLGVKMTLASLENDIVGHLSSYPWSYIKKLNSDDSYYRRRAMRHYSELARIIDFYSERAQNKHRGPDTPSTTDGKVREGTEYGRYAPSDGDNNGWYPLFVSRPDLPLNHTGLLGRRNSFGDTGTYIRDASRWYTDPSRRIFGRKTRSLGAVVVADCSGSMSLSDKDLEELMAMSSGATVLCYSTGNYADADNPNAWVVARKGRQVRHMPCFPGGNGCDGPALRYAVRNLRDSSKQPVIWISDQQVTGYGDVSNQELYDECRRIVSRYGIQVVPTVRQAKKLLHQLQGKG